MSLLRDMGLNSYSGAPRKWVGFKFKRQVPIGAYIVDFVCLEKRLIIEIDGGQNMLVSLQINSS